MRSLAALTKDALEKLLGVPSLPEKQGFIDAEETAGLDAMKLLIDMFVAQQSVASAA